MEKNHRKDYNFLVREYVRYPSKDFEEKLGVADKMLLANIVKRTAITFERFEQPIRHTSFIVAVRKEMELFGYKPNEDAYEFSPIALELLRSKIIPNGD